MRGAYKRAGHGVKEGISLRWHRAELVVVTGWSEVFGCHERGLTLGRPPHEQLSMASQGWCRASRTTSQSPRPWPVAEWPTSSSGKAGAPSSQAGSCPPQRTNITAASRTSCARRALLRVSGGHGERGHGLGVQPEAGSERTCGKRVNAQDGGRGTHSVASSLTAQRGPWRHREPPSHPCAH